MPIAGSSADRGATLEIARAAEAAGFDGLAYTDHPAPSRKWLAAGGHETYDPFAALAFCAAATTTVRLLTYLAVLPYRNPLLLAKTVATVDRLSDGRLTLVVGSGYLRSEFSALGRSFDDRNSLVDEAVGVLTRLWQDDGFSHDGSDFKAIDVASRPGPVQLPHPPIWFGGNSKASRERAARHGDGWAPLFASGAFAQTVRTPSISSLDDLAEGIADLRQRAAAAGRKPDAVGVQVDVGDHGSALADPGSFTERLRDLRALGVTDLMTRPVRDAKPDAVVEGVMAVAALVEQARQR